MKILAYDYQVKAFRSTLDNTIHMGQHNANELTITICTGMQRQHQESTMIHEIIESINWQLALGLEEEKILNLEIGLYNVLKNAGVDLSPLMHELDIAP